MPNFTLGLNILLGLLFASVMVVLVGDLMNKKWVIVLGIGLSILSLGAICVFRFCIT